MSLKNPKYILEVIAQCTGLDYYFLDLLKYSIESHIFYYGQHFRHPMETIVNEQDNAERCRNNLQQFCQIVESLVQIPDWPDRAHARSDTRPIIVSNAYFTWSAELDRAGWQVQKPLWLEAPPSNDIEGVLRLLCRLLNEIIPLQFQILIDPMFHLALKAMQDIFEVYYSHPQIKALFVPYTPPFFEGLAVDTFRKLGKLSFLAIHGLPGVYRHWQDREREVDFTLVWGEAIKRNFVETGMVPERIIITGHPSYQRCPAQSLRFGFEDILVLTYSIGGAPSRNVAFYQNRGDCLHYAYRIEAVLKRLGVERARLRPHPAESAEWYNRFIDRNFYTIDQEPLNRSLERSSLVIGPTSTVFIESLINGVNYVVFNPSVQDYNPAELRFNIAPPFDGSDPRVPTAFDDIQLQSLLQEKRMTDLSIVQDYIGNELDLSRLEEQLAIKSD